LNSKSKLSIFIVKVTYYIPGTLTTPILQVNMVG
jgi:hypothetical protein